ncbi:hypothetical protein [uncultured Tenacibaculum sp.]|uniref:hypothetical protein n=1 Tax=uncultured Tenacibaculum sp. TaxID=174713 RepID=UPI0026164659|nr:hypothetical protein [uncultured Tenacibaculum sp.]
MKKYSFILSSLLFLCFSCNRNKYEKRLIGSWYSIDENEKIVLEKDSLSIYPLYNKVKWSATDNSIIFKHKNFFNDSIHKVNLKYIFKNDTLLITPFKDSINIPIKFIKKNNFLDFLFSKNQVNITLPVNYNIEHIRVEPKYGIKIFLDLENDSIIAKTNYSNNLKKLNSDLKKHVSILKKDIIFFKEDYKHMYKDLNDKELEKLWIKFNVHFSIYADKEISTKELRFYYKKLKKVKEINKIYRIYDINESMYVDFYRLKGVKL